MPVYCAKCNSPVHGRRITPLAEVEKQTIFAALKAHGGDRIEAAASLGIGISTIYKKLKEYEEA
jgi:DNA-binding NtrC family response regulator